MKITAKFASTCPCCNVRIAVGSSVEWVKGSPARHVACANTPIAATTTSRQARRPYGSGHGSAAKVRGYASYCTDNEFCGCFDCAS